MQGENFFVAHFADTTEYQSITAFKSTPMYAAIEHTTKIVTCFFNTIDASGLPTSAMSMRVNVTEPVRGACTFAPCARSACVVA